MGRTRCAVVTTHPIQYQAPWFQALARVPKLEVRVFFGALPDSHQQGAGFGVEFAWDLPLLEGYDWQVLENVAALPSLSAFRGIDTPDVGAVLKDWGADLAIVLGWQSYSLLQALVACRRQGIPVLVRGDSNDRAPRAIWKQWLHRLLLRQYDGCLAVGIANTRFYRAGGVSSDNIFSCPHFVDNRRFQVTADALGVARAQLRTDWGIAEGSTCFLFVGKMVPKKRPLELLSALAMVCAAGQRVHLLMVGSGELAAEARAFSEARQLPVTFVGFLNQTELPRAYAAADCLVLPSDAWETWGLVVNEAMACGLPAIVSDQVGCGPDLVIDGQTGATFPLGDVPALAARIAAIAADPAAAAAMGARARQRVLADYSVERAVEGTLAAVRAVVRRRDP